MKRALILGGAATVWRDADTALDLSPFEVIVACNDVIEVWPGRLDAVVTLHPEKMPGWLHERADNGYPTPGAVFVRENWAEKSYTPDVAEGIRALGLTEINAWFPGQMISASSGAFAAKTALFDLGCDVGVLCGVPMSREAGHFFDERHWSGAARYREGWLQAMPAIKDRLRSCSGWTRALLGAPTREFLAPRG